MSQQTLNNISAEKNSTIIFPLPIDLLGYFAQVGKKQNIYRVHILHIRTIVFIRAKRGGGSASEVEAALEHQPTTNSSSNNNRKTTALGTRRTELKCWFLPKLTEKAEFCARMLRTKYTKKVCPCMTEKSYSNNLLRLLCTHQSLHHYWRFSHHFL